jgi:hypothetical protein
VDFFCVLGWREVGAAPRLAVLRVLVFLTGKGLLDVDPTLITESALVL